jgi:PAS domain S-box-containing protein
MKDAHASLGERTLVEEELFRLAEIVKFSEDAIIGANLDGIILSWNPGAERIYGYTAQQIKGQHLLMLIPPDRRDALQALLEKTSQGEHVEAFETRRVRKNGAVIHLSTTISSVRDADKIKGTSLVTREITKLKEVEETLAKERTLLQIVLDNLTGHIYVKDAVGRYILDNPAHREFLGVVNPDEVTGRTVFDFFPTEIAHQYHADDIEIMRSGNSLLNREEVTVTRSGEKKWLSTTKVPFRNNQSEIVGLVCMSRDITERKLASTR